MIKLFSFFFDRKGTSKESESKFRLIEGWDAYQEAVKLFTIKNPKERNDEQALLLFDKAIDCGIKDAYSLRALCLQGLDYHYDAIEDFDQALLNEKNDPNLYFGRGHSKKIIADYDGAISDLKQAVELSKLPTKLNGEYNDEIGKSGWQSATQYFSFQLQDAIDRKEKTQSEALKELYLGMAKKIKRRPQ